VSFKKSNNQSRCNWCDDILDLTDTKNGIDRKFCRYGGKPFCNACGVFSEREEEMCRYCKGKLRIPSCVKESAMYIAQLGRVRNEIMQDSDQRIMMNKIFKILRDAKIPVQREEAKIVEMNLK